jgi:hypothetical protein
MLAVLLRRGFISTPPPKRGIRGALLRAREAGRPCRTGRGTGQQNNQFALLHQCLTAPEGFLGLLCSTGCGSSTAMLRVSSVKYFFATAWTSSAVTVFNFSSRVSMSRQFSAAGFQAAYFHGLRHQRVALVGLGGDRLRLDPRQFLGRDALRPGCV